MSKFRGTDFLLVLRGLKAVSRAATNITEAELKEAWASSSSSRPGFKNLFAKSYNPENISKDVNEVVGRSLAVAEGLKEYSLIAAQRLIKENFNVTKSFNQESPVAQEFLDPNFQQGMIIITFIVMTKLLFLLVIIPGIDFKSSHNEFESPLHSFLDTTSVDSVNSNSPNDPSFQANIGDELSDRNIPGSMKGKTNYLFEAS